MSHALLSWITMSAIITSPPIPELIPSRDGITVVLIRKQHLSTWEMSIPDQIGLVVSKLEQAVQDYGTLADVYVTPEYSFAVDRAYEDYAIDIHCEVGFDHCSLSSTSAQYSKLVIKALESLSDLAVQHGVDMFLGTVIERYDAQLIDDIPSDYAYMNTMIRVHPDGRFELLRRKSNLDFRTSGPCERRYRPPTACELAGMALQHQTIRSVSFTTRHGSRFDVLPIICGERTYRPFLDAVDAKAIVVDALIGVEHEGNDLDYERFTQLIQQGTWSSSIRPWHDIVETYIERYADGYQIVRPGGYLAIAEAFAGSAGAIQLQEPPQPTWLRFTDDYLVAFLPKP